jgi:hypothetical protein
MAAMTVLVLGGATAGDRINNQIGVLTCTLAEPREAAGTDARTPGQMRDALCTFKPTGGAEETYTGKIEGVSITPEHQGALLWRVLLERGAMEPGLLQQVYTADRTKPADQKPPLIGESNSAISLRLLADESEGSASAPQKPGPTGFVILNVELKLKSTAG